LRAMPILHLSTHTPTWLGGKPILIWLRLQHL
jgi:hypothetical protein